MPDPKGTNAHRATEIHFTDIVSIQKADLDRAIGGGINKVYKAAPRQVREEILAQAYLRLVEHFARGGEVVTGVRSLAYQVGRNLAIDVLRRRRNTVRRTEDIDAADATPTAEISGRIETGEEWVMRLSETKRRERVLNAAIGRISADDRAALLGVIGRETALPRGTAKEVRSANAAAQREKRARDRLAKAVRSRDGLEL